MAFPACLNTREDWTIWDKNKTSQAYSHKNHKARACKKDIAHADRIKVLLNATPHARDPGNGDTVLIQQEHSVEL